MLTNPNMRREPKLLHWILFHILMICQFSNHLKIMKLGRMLPEVNKKRKQSLGLGLSATHISRQKIEADLLGSRLKQWHLFEPGVNITEHITLPLMEF
ncbi:unnamed protein product [Acanthoscelides obtectus]|uniref:Uncharacterized protein n=1 Tax=Acanthoscelides obtectus TaxID=200917 RepID=A0A9P0Q000_ACAOB|nr:unnamed protein product [Acanthoscelides obtectus]CAK1651112.1 hypothetical protein AOBTE_LOCUS17066 [Acanthoscelides obtectus]